MNFNLAFAAFAVLISSASTSHAEIVFSDDFSEDGPLTSLTPDVGDAYMGGGTFSVSGGALDMATGDRANNNANFRALGAGERLTATVEVTSLNSTGAWGGVSLFADAGATGGEIAITGQGDSWGVDVSSVAGGMAPAGISHQGNLQSGSTVAGTITFVYDYDTGNYTWTGPDGTVFQTGDSEDANAELPLQSIRIADSADGSGALFTVTSISIEITDTPDMLVGDFNSSGAVDCDDIDSYVGNLGSAAAGGLEALDLVADGTIDSADVAFLIENLVETTNGEVGTFLGDVNCDGSVNVLGDAFVLVANLNAAATSYLQGDLNLDGTVSVLGDAFILVANLGLSNNP